MLTRFDVWHDQCDINSLRLNNANWERENKKKPNKISANEQNDKRIESDFKNRGQT